MSHQIVPDDLFLALQSLDSSDDKHWTPDGLPSVAAVSAAYSEAQGSPVKLSRKAISDLAPDFTRSNPVFPDSDGEGPGEDLSADADADQSGGVETPLSDGAGAGDAAQSAPDSNEATGGDGVGLSPPESPKIDPAPGDGDALFAGSGDRDEAASIRRAIADLQTVRSRLDADIKALARQAEEVDNTISDLDRSLRKIAPPPKPAEEIQKYLRQQRAHRSSAIEAATEVARVVGGSGIDPAEVLNRGRALADAYSAKRPAK